MSRYRDSARQRHKSDHRIYKSIFPDLKYNCAFLLCSYNILQVYESSDHGIFRVDDVFVTGMLAEKANVSHRDISDLITFYEDWDEEVSSERKSRCLLNHIFKRVLSQTVGNFRSQPIWRGSISQL